MALPVALAQQTTVRKSLRDGAQYGLPRRIPLSTQTKQNQLN